MNRVDGFGATLVSTITSVDDEVSDIAANRDTAIDDLERNVSLDEHPAMP